MEKAAQTRDDGNMIRAFFRLAGLSLVVLPAASDATQPLPVGSEFQVATYTVGPQISPSAAMSENGEFVIVWMSGHEGNAYDIFAQRYDGAGHAVDSEFRVNSFVPGIQAGPEIAMDAAGSFVIVWSSRSSVYPPQDGSFGGIFAQRYASTGTEIGTEFQVNTYTLGSQLVPDVAANADGAFVAVWSSDQDGSGSGVFGQRYDSEGLAVGTEFQINTRTIKPPNQTAVTVSPDGGFVVVWSDRQYRSEDPGDVFGQRFDADGSRLGTEFQVNGYTLDYQGVPSIASDRKGNFVVVWSSLQGHRGEVFAQRFDRRGSRVGTEFQVNTNTVDVQVTCGPRSVSVDETGGFTIVWESNTQDGSGSGVFMQQFDREGERLGSEVQVNTYTASEQGSVIAVSPRATTGFVVSWVSLHQDSGKGPHAHGIFAQLFELSPGRSDSTGSGDGCTVHPVAETDGARTFLLLFVPAGMAWLLRRCRARSGNSHTG